MKTRRNLALILGSFLLLLDIFANTDPAVSIVAQPVIEEDTFGRFLSSNLLGIIGIIILIRAIVINNRIKEREREKMLDSFNDHPRSPDPNPPS